ncbi:MAG: hypothetical protein CVU87_05445 [Firmicutes bacterium HGW-Firmicutes-12]|jgi:ABC-type molybdate transport system substrate-binding protein|nr:MAG: hypothetical protein CVU87_05445 [Firmicutes bacterium HGW-Firmicutes-12]
MKKISIKFITILIVLGLSISLTACGNKDLTKDKTPQEIVIAAAEAMQNINTYSITMAMHMDMVNPETGNMESIVMTGNGDIIVEPLKMHMNMDIQIPQMPMSMEIYAVNEDNTIIEYLNVPGQTEKWMKIELPLDENMQQMMNPAQSAAFLQEAMLNAKFLGEEEKDEIETIIIETILKPEAFGKFMQMPGSDILTADLDSLFASMDNFKYKIWVRKDNLYITKAEMDLGEIFNTMIDTMVDISEEEKEILSKMKAQMTMEYVDFDVPVEVTVPDEVINNAEDFSNMLNSAN